MPATQNVFFLGHMLVICLKNRFVIDYVMGDMSVAVIEIVKQL